MRIAYVTETYPPEVNGVSLTVERSVRHLRRNGHAVLLTRPRQPHEQPMDSRAEWRTVGLRIPMYPDLRMGLALPSALRRRFDAFDADLVHVATQGPLGRAAVAAASSLGLPVTSDFRTNFHVYAQHYGLGFASRLVTGYLRGFHNRTAMSFVPCRRLRAELLGLGFERVEVVGRGVDARRFAPEHRSAALRLRWGAGAHNPVLLYVGRLAPEKNVPLALRAFRVVQQRVPHARMVVVGDGPLRARLQAAHPDVHFAGAQHGEALAAHYASADVFLFPSLSETFGNVTLEALASGLAVVAFDAAAAGELIRDGRNGLLATAGDEDSFIDAACLAAGGSVDFAPLREQARRTALANDWEPVLQGFEQRLSQAACAVQPLPQASLA
jgi:glycosyltransferase involved in cell wall biosynthesis